MLCTSSDQGENNGAIVSQMTNPHTPQDFTVSRLLSTPTNSLGKNPRNSRSKTRMSKRLRNGNGRELNAIRDRFTERERDRETRVGPRLTRFDPRTDPDSIEITHFQSCCSRYTALMNTQAQWSHSRIATPVLLLLFSTLLLFFFFFFFFVKAQLPCLGRHLEIFHSNFHLPSNSV